VYSIPSSPISGTVVEWIHARVRLGEGALWICDENGPIESGDLLCSASVPGYAMRQDDDIVRSYTVAKATMSCNFSPVDVPVQTLTQDTNGNTCGSLILHDGET
jgi:hypothetical protein